MQPQTATRTAERADEDQPPKAQEQQAPGTATPNPPMDINERPADPKTSENEGPAPQVKPGTAPAVDPQTGVVQPGAPTVVGSAQTVVGNQPAAPAQQPRQPEAQPKAEGEGERSAPAGGNPRGLGAGDCADLVRSATGLGLAADFAADLIGREGMTADRARQLIIDEAAKLQEGTRVHPVTVTSVRDEDETRARSLSAALLHKRYPSAFPLAGAEGDLARQWMGMPLLHMARVELERAGYRDAWTMSPNEAAHRALMPGYGVRQGGYLGIRTGGLQTRDVGGLHSTSDFASVLLDVIHKSARQAYDLLLPTYTPIARQATHRDYRLYNSVQLSNLGTLSRVREHGEYVSTTLTDSREAYAVAKYGARVGITREALINDDMGMLTDIPGEVRDGGPQHRVGHRLVDLPGQRGAGGRRDLFHASPRQPRRLGGRAQHHHRGHRLLGHGRPEGPRRQDVPQPPARYLVARRCSGPSSPSSPARSRRTRSARRCRPRSGR
jgi:hypothetical protein